MNKAITTICAVNLMLATRLLAQAADAATDPVEAARQSSLALMRSSAGALNDTAMGQLLRQPTATAPAAGQVTAVTRTPAVAINPSPATQVATTAPAAQTRPAPEPTADELAAAALQKAVSDEPLALADDLYTAGNLKAAAIFYEQATTRGKTDSDKEWALFQLANCKSQADEAAAVAVYKQFLQQYPKSSWSDAAASRMQLLIWRQTRSVAQGANK